MQKPKWKQSMGVTKREYGEATSKNPQHKNESRRKARQLMKRKRGL